MKNNICLWIGRAQLLGDTVSALPIARYFKKIYPESHLIWPIAKKCAQGAPLYINCPWLDEIYVCDGQEGPESKRDLIKMNSCDFIGEINPQHPDNRYPKEFDIYSESWRMFGLPIEEWNKLTPDEQQPKLFKWWNPLPRIFGNKKTVAYWCQAGYGRENKRNNSQAYIEKLISCLWNDGYSVAQFGSENDWNLFENVDVDDSKFKRLNNLSFFHQIQLTLECDLMIGSDSGSALLVGAYQFPQVSLLTDHWGNSNNPMALSSNNIYNKTLFSSGNADNIKIEDVLSAIKNI